jgi:Flp pilus assembly CpaF family ATPase
MPAAVAARANILVAGGTSTGKTTPTNALLAEVARTQDRIPTREVRGSDALDLVKAWGTGHPGGIGTINAGSGIGALRRLGQLIQEAVVTVPRALPASPSATHRPRVLERRYNTRRKQAVLKRRTPLQALSLLNTVLGHHRERTSTQS